MLPKYEDLFEWLKCHGFKNRHNLEIQVFSDMGAGVVALNQKSVNDNDDYVVTIPSSLLVCASKLRLAQPEIYSGIVDEDLCMVLFLILERKKGKHSKWYSYLNVLQENSCLPFEWTDQPVYLKHLPVNFRRLLISSNHSMKRLHKKATEFLFNNGEDLSYDLFRWAYTNYSMRSLYLELPKDSKDSSKGTEKESEAFLVPFADCFNHHVNGDGEAKLNADMSFNLEVTAPTSGQLFVNYNQEMSNEEYYSVYGFSNIPYSSVQFSSSRLSIVASGHDRISFKPKLLISLLSSFDGLKDPLATLASCSAFMNTVFDMRWPTKFCDKRISLEQTSNGIQFGVSTRRESSSISIKLCKQVDFLSPLLDALLQVLSRDCSQQTVIEQWCAATEQLATEIRCDIIHSMTPAQTELYNSLVYFIFKQIDAFSEADDFPLLVDSKDSRQEVSLPKIYQRLWNAPHMPREMQNIICNRIVLYLTIRKCPFQFSKKI